MMNAADQIQQQSEIAKQRNLQRKKAADSEVRRTTVEYKTSKTIGKDGRKGGAAGGGRLRPGYMKRADDTEKKLEDAQRPLEDIQCQLIMLTAGL